MVTNPSEINTQSLLLSVAQVPLSELEQFFAELSRLAAGCEIKRVHVGVADGNFSFAFD